MRAPDIKLTHQQLLEKLIAELPDSELPFYETASVRANVIWHLAAGLVLLSTIASTVVASLMDASQFGSSGKIWLIILPAVGTLSAGALNIYRPKDKEVLREDGRIEMVDIIRNAESLLADCTNESEYKQAFHQIRERARLLEIAQHRRDAAIRSDKPDDEGLSRNEK